MTHPADKDLIATADGELTGRRARQIRSHLSACWTCRRRMQELESAIGDFVVMQRRADAELPSIEGPRALLRARMTEMGSQAPRSSWLALTGLGLTGLAAIVLLFAAVLLRLSSHSGTAEAEPRLIPDHHLTPGAVVSMTQKEVCSANPPQEHFVPPALADKVFKIYGIRRPKPRQYEVDYLIDPELGGASDPHNLWPQPYAADWNARVKDALEDHLHELVCSGAISLSTAQQEIATDWIGAYKKYFKAASPLPAHYAFAKDPPWDP